MSGEIILHVEQADGTRERLEFPPEQAILKIGRHSSAQVPLRGARVARMHAVLERSEHELLLIDLGAAAGTKVNGRDRNRAEVHDGDVLTFGDCEVRIEVPGGRTYQITPRTVDRPARVGRCPRCEHALTLLRAQPASYRETPMRYLRCDPCGLSAVQSATLEERWGRPDPLADLAAVRRRQTAGELCPACLDDLDRLTLAWDERWVVIEACPGCGCVLLDDGEGFGLDAMIAAIDGREDAEG